MKERADITDNGQKSTKFTKNHTKRLLSYIELFKHMALHYGFLTRNFTLIL